MGGHSHINTNNRSQYRKDNEQRWHHRKNNVDYQDKTRPWIWWLGVLACGSAVIMAYVICRPEHDIVELGENSTAREIFEVNKLYNGGKRVLSTEVLGFITPWNRKGFTFALQFSHKFTMLSPVWYQIKPSGEITGGHDVDHDWLSRLRAQSGPKIIPRFVMEGWTAKSIYEMLLNPRPLVKQIMKQIKEQNFDGLVLEAIQAMMVSKQIQNSAKLQNVNIPDFVDSFLVMLSSALRSAGKRIVIVVSPHPTISSSEDIKLLSPHVDQIVLMTYDYNNRNLIGPNAPYQWVKNTTERLQSISNMESGKVLLGLNFYGYDYLGKIGEPITSSPESITGDSYLQLMHHHSKMDQPLKYLSVDREHVFEYDDDDGYQHSVFYPTPSSILERVLLARNLKVGVQIWEIGQGLESFFRLL